MAGLALVRRNKNKLTNGKNLGSRRPTILLQLQHNLHKKI